MSGLLNTKARPEVRPAPPRRPNLLPPRSYRGCTSTNPRRGTLRSRPVSATTRRRPRRGERSCRDWRPSQRVVLELPEGIHRGVACWRSREHWLTITVPAAYELRYKDIRPQMRSGGISRSALLAVAAARAAHADHRTGRDCRPSNARLVEMTGLSLRQVQRADEALRLLGVATEVLRGRQRTLTERMASWRVGDRGRGWASVWVLHDNPIDLRDNASMTPQPDRVLKGFNSRQRVVTTRRTPSGRGRRACRRVGPDEAGTRLALAWRAHDNAPPWARRHSAEAWSTLLAGPARRGWNARDLNQLITDWLATGHSIPDNPHKPIGLLGAILTSHGPLDERPTAADDARVREELAQRRIQRALARAEHRHHEKARDAGRAALNGPGHAKCRQILAELFERRRQRRYPPDGNAAMNPSPPPPAARRPVAPSLRK